MILLTNSEISMVTGGEMECYCEMQTGNVLGGEIITNRTELGDLNADICKQACCGFRFSGWIYSGPDVELYMDEITTEVKSRELAESGKCA
ncbi:MAG: hypothetical protein KKE11_01825 [Gammaproteobacteria bacterium]|nr:hypothetical protein [Gammaproteobacteria bacterium]